MSCTPVHCPTEALSFTSPLCKFVLAYWFIIGFQSAVVMFQKWFLCIHVLNSDLWSEKLSPVWSSEDECENILAAHTLEIWAFRNGRVREIGGERSGDPSEKLLIFSVLSAWGSFWGKHVLRCPPGFRGFLSDEGTLCFGQRQWFAICEPLEFSASVNTEVLGGHC